MEWGCVTAAPNTSCGPTIFSSEYPGLLKPRALPLPHQELVEALGWQCLSSLSPPLGPAGQRRLGGGAFVPGPRPSTQGRPKVCGASGVLTKPGVHGELQDLLIL